MKFRPNDKEKIVVWPRETMHVQLEQETTLIDRET